MGYTSLHNHSFYSVLDGYASPTEYLARAKELGLRGIALTEHGNVFSSPYIDKVKKDYPGVKVIHGCEVYEASDMKEKDKDSKYFHLVVLVRNEQGRKDLNKLITHSNMEGFYHKPRLDLDAFRKYDCGNFVVTTACLASKLARCEDYNQCIKYIDEYKLMFPHFYLEMQSHKAEDQAVYNRKILQLSKDTNTPYVITTDSHFINEQDYKWQGYLVTIGRNQKGDNAKDSLEMAENYDGCYLQSEQDIFNIMTPQVGEEVVRIGLDNTNVINDMIDDVNIPFQSPQLPAFDIPNEFKSEEHYLKHLTQEGWKRRGFNKLTGDKRTEYLERLKYEYKTICDMGFTGYFLIVQDFCRYANETKMAMGAGRGSAAGSLVCYLLGITNLDPIKYGLIFERFLNPERISYPDVDSDFGDRGKIIKYIEEKYGRDKVCQIVNFVYITPLMAIQDVGRLLGVPYNVTQKISESFKVGTFKQAFEANPGLKDKYAEYNELFEIAERISGRIRGIGQHAAGVCVSKGDLSDYMACKIGKEGEQVVQCDMKIAEAIGLVKLDILGVETLNVVQEAAEDAGLTLWDLDINNEDFETDATAYKLLSEARTNAVFQLESAGMKDLLLKIKPKNMDELSDIVALYRPDTMPMLEEYISVKNGEKEHEYLHDDLHDILEKTNGVWAYQEQILEVVRKFGGRSYGGADLLRRAIGKKIPEQVKLEVDKLRTEIIENGYDKRVSDGLCDLLQEMGNYSFNRSHSMSYSVLALQTAYLKSHYPVQFVKALLNSERDNNGKLNKYMVDAKEFGVEILPPHINKSSDVFEIVDGKILFGLSAITGLGESITQHILDERNANGNYKDIDDLVNRVPELKKNQIITLIKAGAIPTKDKEKRLLKYADSLFERREFKPLKTISGTLAKLKENYNIETKDKEERLRLYNIAKEREFDEYQRERYNKYMNEFREKYLADKDFWEFQSLAVFIENNPFESVYEYIIPFDEVPDDSSAVVVGIISNIVKKVDRNGKKYGHVQLYSAFGIVEVTCWASQYSKYSDLLVKGSKISVRCKKKEGKAFAAEIKTYEQWYNDTEILRKEVRSGEAEG